MGILGVGWIIGAVAFSLYAGKLGRRYDAPNDGCLLGFACQVLLITGGAIGFLLSVFPWHLLTAAAGAIVLPSVACLVFARRMRRWRPR